MVEHQAPRFDIEIPQLGPERSPELDPTTRALLAGAADLSARCFTNAWTFDDLSTSLSNPRSKLWLATAVGCGHEGTGYEPGRKVVGYAICRDVLDEAELLSIAVSPEHRRRGMGASLMRAILCWAAELELQLITLEVRWGNDNALSIYRSAGFEDLDRRKRYYPDGEDARILAWRPKPQP